MNVVDLLFQLQNYIKENEKNKKVILDGSYLYLLRKMKKKFEDTKKLYNEKVDTIKNIKKEYAEISKELKEINFQIDKNENDLYNNAGSDMKVINVLQNNIKANKANVKLLEDKAITLLEREEKLKLDIEVEKAELINLKNNFYTYKETISKKIETAKKNCVKQRRILKK